MSKDAADKACPIKDVLDRLGDKWTINIVLQLGEKDMLRFNELKSSINNISQRMLTVTLKSLEHDGLVTRTIFPIIPPRVEYKLTPLGQSLYSQFSTLVDWAHHNMDEILKARKYYDSKGIKS